MLSDELQAKLHDALALYAYDAVLVTGHDNFAYLTQTSLPFAPDYPDRPAFAIQPRQGRACAISPSRWAGALLDQGWQGDIASYPQGKPFAALCTAAAESLAAMGLDQARVGFDSARMPTALAEALKEALPGVQWLPCDGMLRALRLVKTPAEQDLLEQAARHAERAIVSALNHTEGTVDAVSYSLAEAAERLRVHVGEFGGAATGHVGAVQGADARHYHVPPRGSLVPGNLLRFELSSQYRGYWSSAARTVSIGPPTTGQVKAYEGNRILKDAAIEKLRAGHTCQEVFQAVEARAEQEGIVFFKGAGIGHGVGASEREAPYLVGHDLTPLEAGMVLALDIVTYGPEQELIRSVDTFDIREDGDEPRLLSWYRNWDRLYAVEGVTARHG